MQVLIKVMHITVKRSSTNLLKLRMAFIYFNPLDYGILVLVVFQETMDDWMVESEQEHLSH